MCISVFIFWAREVTFPLCSSQKNLSKVQVMDKSSWNWRSMGSEIMVFPSSWDTSASQSFSYSHLEMYWKVLPLFLFPHSLRSGWEIAVSNTDECKFFRALFIVFWEDTSCIVPLKRIQSINMDKIYFVLKIYK